MRARWIWRGVNGLTTCVFLLFAVVQYNDPDPVRWMAIYLAAALCCALEFFGRPGSFVHHDGDLIGAGGLDESGAFMVRRPLA